MSDVRGRHVANLQRETEAGAPPPSLATLLGATAPDAPAESILTSARLLKRETYRGRPLVTRLTKKSAKTERARTHPRARHAPAPT